MAAVIEVDGAAAVGVVFCCAVLWLWGKFGITQLRII